MTDEMPDTVWISTYETAGKCILRKYWSGGWPCVFKQKRDRSTKYTRHNEYKSCAICKDPETVVMNLETAKRLLNRTQNNPSVDIEKLKNSFYKLGLSHYARACWNDCIDHLHQQGRINSLG